MTRIISTVIAFSAVWLMVELLIIVRTLRNLYEWERRRAWIWSDS